MPTALMPALVVALLAAPVVGAALAALLGERRRDAVCWVSLASALVTLGLAVVLATAFAREKLLGPTAPAVSPTGQPTFHPLYVPGGPGLREDSFGQTIKDEYGT